MTVELQKPEQPTLRKVVQICTETRNRTALFALCDDGSIWVKYFLGDLDPNPSHPNEKDWQMIDGLPQDPAAALLPGVLQPGSRRLYDKRHG